MQAEDVNLFSLNKTNISNKNMTCSLSGEVSSSEHSPDQIYPINVPRYFATEPHLEGINLEDDIERVEVSSSCSSAASEDHLIEPNKLLIPVKQLQHKDTTTSNLKTWLQKVAELQQKVQKENTNEPAAQNKLQCNKSNSLPVNNVPQIAANRIVNYQDLPYMGEITLDNSKPRRGRKPKKADICHLIYKNYGTIFPGTPNANSYIEKGRKSKEPNDNINRDVHNKIISSLLEKRLTQETKKSNENVMQLLNAESRIAEDNQPLNLCVRDLNQLQICLSKTPDTFSNTLIKPEPESDEDDIELVERISPPSVCEAKLGSATPDNLSTSSSDTCKTPNKTYWPNSSIFVHPMALEQQFLYYQKLAGLHALPKHNPKPPPDVGLEQMPFPSGSTQNLRKIMPKSKPKKPDLQPQPEETFLASNFGAKRHLPNLGDKTTAKRKRSAIFIPPISSENSTNPATEVSICKFKFTGGAKPSLQEKKMLSVDSGGNFRYYSGTGDKSMRGYEFFPREALQQQASNMPGSSTGAFLKASGEKIYPGSDFNESKAKSEFMLTPDLPNTQAILDTNDAAQRHKKRKSRKSLQREKLEQTFKEKGFLIQTQQLESAEGATYCKFRQLRKFTRYLFRSWKDYLPGSVGENPDEEKLNPHHILNSDAQNVTNNILENYQKITENSNNTN